MTAPTDRVWTDLKLVPEAEQLLADAGVPLEVHAEGETAGLATATAIIAGSRLTADAAFFAGSPRLRIIARSGIGYDRIDVAAATAAGVCAVNTPEAPTESTAEFAILLMLAVSRRLLRGAVPLAGGHWVQGEPVIGGDLAGRTLGLIGCGRIGRRVAEIARALGLTVQAYDPLQPRLPPEVRSVPSLAALLATSDIVSLHAPATPANRHLLGAATLAQLKPGAILINTARGPLVDEAALLAALDSGRLGGAGLDVWDPEPPPAAHPLLRHPAVVATPHMAASTREGRRRSHLAATRQVLQVLRGETPAHLLNPEVWPGRR